MSNDGGHAFPGQHVTGMSLRDWYAGQALAGVMANSQLLKVLNDEANENGNRSPNEIASFCTGIAQAMLNVWEQTR